MSREAISQRRAERYEEYRLFEEKTDLGERLSLPIENHLVLEAVGEAVYGRDIIGGRRRMTDWSRDAYESSVNDPAFAGSNSVERIRRRHEYDEAVAVEQLAVGEAMVVFSPIPDAALTGDLSIQGYRADLARTFCRLYLREPNAVAAVTLSLERSDKQALREAARAIGMSLPASMQSEEVLATRYISPLSGRDFTELPDIIRARYDLSLYEQTGVTYFAGNHLAGRQDSMRFINDNHDIIEEHMAFLAMIEARLDSGPLRDRELEQLRQRTAAALDERLHGGVVESIADTSVSDRMSTNDYGGECATGAAQSTQEQMGLAQGKHTTNCPLCGTRGVTATVEGETITCSDCAGSVDICTGKVTRKSTLASRSETFLRQATANQPKPTRSKEAELAARYGEKVMIKTVKTIGGADTLVVNTYGEVLAKV